MQLFSSQMLVYLERLKLTLTTLQVLDLVLFEIIFAKHIHAVKIVE